MEPMTLEQQLFDWESWDEGGPASFVFYNVTLVVPIGKFPVGHKFPSAYFNGEHSWVALQVSDEEQYTFELKLTIGAEMSKPPRYLGC